MVVICTDIDSFLLEFYSGSQVSVTLVKGQSDKDEVLGGRMTIALTRMMCCMGGSIHDGHHLALRGAFATPEHLRRGGCNAVEPFLRLLSLYGMKNVQM